MHSDRCSRNGTPHSHTELSLCVSRCHHDLCLSHASVFQVCRSVQVSWSQDPHIPVSIHNFDQPHLCFLPLVQRAVGKLLHLFMITDSASLTLFITLQSASFQRIRSLPRLKSTARNFLRSFSGFRLCKSHAIHSVPSHPLRVHNNLLGSAMAVAVARSCEAFSVTSLSADIHSLRQFTDSTSNRRCSSHSLCSMYSPEPLPHFFVSPHCLCNLVSTQSQPPPQSYSERFS